MLHFSVSVGEVTGHHLISLSTSLCLVCTDEWAMAAMMMMAMVTEVRLVLTTGLPYDFKAN